jgi:hypothetical protein
VVGIREEVSSSINCFLHILHCDVDIQVVDHTHRQGGLQNGGNSEFLIMVVNNFILVTLFSRKVFLEDNATSLWKAIYFLIEGITISKIRCSAELNHI